MMAESLESRKFERKQQFDLPLPVRTKNRESSTAAATEGGDSNIDTLGGGTMAFSLLTKKGNRQQVRIERLRKMTCHGLSNLEDEQTRTVELPSDSHFAIAMKHQQQAEKEEQQRIKSLVLNYNLGESEDQDGELLSAFPGPNHNIHTFLSPGHEKAASYHHNRSEHKPGKERVGQRTRKLQLSDVDWYEKSPKPTKHHCHDRRTRHDEPSSR